MPETVKMMLVLTLVSGAASLALAAIDDSTAPLIAENERQFTLRSIRRVIPEGDDPDPCSPGAPGFDNSPDADAVCVDGTVVYRGRRGDEIVGLAMITVGDEAYSGTIRCLVGLGLDGAVTGLEVLRHAETPGLGAKVEGCAWRAQLVGHGPADITWKVTKDGGDIDQVSGATISSRSMIDAVLDAQRLLAERREGILNGAPMKDGEVCDAE